MVLRYDHPNSVVRREDWTETEAGATGVRRFARFQKMRIFALHSVVTALGTSDTTGNLVSVAYGGTALGTFTMGTTSVGDTQTINVSNVDVAALEVISLTNGTDATGRASIGIEFEVLPDAVQST